MRACLYTRIFRSGVWKWAHFACFFKVLTGKMEYRPICLFFFQSSFHDGYLFFYRFWSYFEKKPRRYIKISYTFGRTYWRRRSWRTPTWIWARPPRTLIRKRPQRSRRSILWTRNTGRWRILSAARIHNIQGVSKLDSTLTGFLRTSLWSNIQTFAAVDSRILVCWRSSWARWKALDL